MPLESLHHDGYVPQLGHAKNCGHLLGSNTLGLASVPVITPDIWPYSSISAGKICGSHMKYKFIVSKLCLCNYLRPTSFIRSPFWLHKTLPFTNLFFGRPYPSHQLYQSAARSPNPVRKPHTSYLCMCCTSFPIGSLDLHLPAFS